MLDSSLNAKLSGFAFFEMVDRKSQEALIKDAVASGADADDLPVTGVEADFVVVARIASLAISSRSTQAGSEMHSFDVTFDFKWISKVLKRVIMTESIKPPTRAANSQVDLAKALNRAAEVAARDFCNKIAVKYAPPARVLQTRGDGAAARISIGKNYGVSEGTKVCFYEIVDNSAVGGEKRDAIDETCHMAADALRDVAYPAKVIKVGRKDITINMTDEEVKEEDVFDVIEADEPMVDPDTGAFLGYDGDDVGRVVITRTGPQVSKAKPVEDGDFGLDDLDTDEHTYILRRVSKATLKKEAKKASQKKKAAFESRF